MVAEFEPDSEIQILARVVTIGVTLQCVVRARAITRRAVSCFCTAKFHYLMMLTTRSRVTITRLLELSLNFLRAFDLWFRVFGLLDSSCMQSNNASSYFCSKAFKSLPDQQATLPKAFEDPMSGVDHVTDLTLYEKRWPFFSRNR